MPDELRDEALAATETAASNWTGNDPATPAGVLIALNVVLWYVRPDWEARLAGAVLTILTFPVLQLLLVPSRR